MAQDFSLESPTVLPAEEAPVQLEEGQSYEDMLAAYSFESGQEDMEPADELAAYETGDDNQPDEREIAAVLEQQVATLKGAAPKPCVSRTCWAKAALNSILGLSLPETSVLDEATKKALGDFQLKHGLPSSQKIDAATERALLEQAALRRHTGTAFQAAAEQTITEAKTKIEDWTAQGVSGVTKKPQHILNSFRDPRKVYAFVLHHMAFKRKSRKTGKYSDPESYLNTGSHFCIMLDGRIIQLHPMSRMIWHGNCLSGGSVAVEFEGNFPNIKGGWWIAKDEKTGKPVPYPDKDHPTQAQYEAGRFLAGYLKLVLDIRHILAHRQGSDSRENDPGPDIWYHVGQWAVDKLGIADGGPGFKCGTGNPILPQWRTWGAAKTQPELEDLPEEYEASYPDYEPQAEGIEPAFESEMGEEPEFEQYSLAYKLGKANDWAHLLSFKVPDDLVARLKARNMSVQYAHNESYSNDLNMDFYRLRIDKFPTVNGETFTAERLIRYIRLNINSLVNTSYCDWAPYSAAVDKPVWESNNPLGAVMRQDIKGPDNASVMVSAATPNGWRFTTVATPDTGRHPVSGHREFFIARDSVTKGTYFIIKGLDMMSTGIAGMGLPIAGAWGYSQGDKLWRSMREKVMQFINAHGGKARMDITYAEQVEWRFIYRDFRHMLANVFGKGAGSSENSSFFSFQLTE